jgi:Ca-activated chloride channel family protein
MIIFYKPQYLFLLFLIPLIVFLHINSLRTSKTRAIKFANFDAIARISGVEVFSKNLTILYLNILIIVLLVLSISGMNLTTEVNASKLSFVIAIDSSISMAAQDVLPTRFEAAKKAGIDFLQMVPQETRMGVVSFSSNSVIEQEVTSDKSLIKNAIGNIQLKSSGGTDAINALITSSNLLASEETRAIIFISDGGINTNSVQELVDYANNNRVSIYTLGVGTLAGGNDTNGGEYKLSEDTLKILAESTGGKYYNIANLDNFYSSLDNIIQTVRKKIVLDMSFYLLSLALLLIVITFYITNNRYRIFP